MQINASSANSINFIEQKKSNTSSSDLRNSTAPEKGDSFVNEASISTTLLELNDSLSTLQIASNTLLKLKSNGEELGKLTQRHTLFQSQELELSEKFEEITIEMLDIVDNTMIKNTQLFYTTHSFKVGNEELELSLKNDFGIEDLNLFNEDELKSFDANLSVVEKEVNEIKKQIELANFNTMASLDKNSPLLDVKRNIDYEKLTVNVEDMKRAHNTSSLKDKVSFLLSD